MSELNAYLLLVLVGFLPTDVWRAVGLVAVRGINEESELFLWAALELRLGRPDRALRLAVYAGLGSDTVGGSVNSLWGWSGVADTAARAAALLPADEVERAIREGRAMSDEEALAYALHETPDDPAPTAARRGRFDLTARERELIILAVLTSLGSSDPQVQAHVRALRAIDVPFEDIEETILQTAPYAGFPRAVNALKVLRAEQEAEA